MVKFSFITLFPEIIHSYFNAGVIRRAVDQGIIQYDVFNPRDYTPLAHKQVDDRPYGGGAGMVLRADVLKVTLDAVFVAHNLDLVRNRDLVRIVVTAAAGKPFTQEKAREFSTTCTHLVFIAGRYEGIDQRFIDRYADDVLHVGQYVVSGGELPSLMMMDATARLLPGVLGNDASLIEESYAPDVASLEYPQYTRPADFEGSAVPEPLLSGNHERIAAWRKSQQE